MKFLLFSLAYCVVASLSVHGGEPKSEPGAPDPAFSKVVDDPKLPRVLLIGDSISIGYTIGVQKALAGKANVHRIPENGGPTTNGIAKIDKWLGDGKWDVIHFNWGLHDLKLVNGAHQVSLEDYEKNLRELVKKMKASGAKLIWASTTPVPDGKLDPPRKSDDVPAYNAIAKKIMDEEAVSIDDLFARVQPRLAELQRPNNVHYTAKGSEVLAEHVASTLSAALPKK